MSKPSQATQVKVLSGLMRERSLTRLKIGSIEMEMDPAGFAVRELVVPIAAGKPEMAAANHSGVPDDPTYEDVLNWSAAPLPPQEE